MKLFDYLENSRKNSWSPLRCEGARACDGLLIETIKWL
jgi:hypothetical protein